ncbi:MAG: hypothetical protein ACRD04_03655 [Terriglobales bacterium]
MANVLNTHKQIAAIAALAGGPSIRSIERITGAHRDTITRLGVKFGQGCTALMGAQMRDPPCNRLEMDEIWGFVGKKERNVPTDDHRKANPIYAWAHDTDDPANPKRYVTVLHIPPVVPPQAAVKAAIVQELKDRDRSQEN